MLKMPWTFGASLTAAACMLVCVEALAQTNQPLIDAVHTVAVPTQAVPVEEHFDIATPGTYQVTLNDLGAQFGAALNSAELAVSFGNATVGTPIVSTSGSASWSTTFTAAAAGTYWLHVIGMPGTAPGSGAIGMQVTNTANNASVASFSDSLALPSTGVSSLVGVLSDFFEVTTSGNYQVTLTDMQMPAALSTLTLTVVVQGGSIVTTVNADTAPNSPTATTTVALQSGVTYQIFAGGEASTTVGAGLYGVNISATGATTPVYSHVTPVGAVTTIGSPSLTAQNYTLSLADLKYPTTLTQLGAAVTFNGQLVSTQSASGTAVPFIVPATATYQVFAYGIPASNGQGSYGVGLQPPSGAPIISVARGVSDPASSIVAYSYDTSIVTAETYEFNLADFGYPASLTTVSAVAAQNGVVLGTPLTSAGQTNITPAVGPMSMVVFAQPAATPSSTGVPGGLFGIDIEASGAAAPVFQASQGVGNLFSVQTATVTMGGYYQVAVTDLKFPLAFANLSVIVTQGITKVGSNFGGTLSFNATAGDYLINLVTTPDPTAGAGTYSLVVGTAPAAASVSLQPSATSVTSGGTVTLSWQSTGTTSCSASSSPGGVWSGSIGLTGTFTTPALSSTTTFTVTCVGSDGSTPSASTTITVSSGSSGGGHHGGAIDISLVALLLGALVLRLGVARMKRLAPPLREEIH
jgi:hypothetical protein